MKVLLRRNTFRDYYDIYSILKEGYNLHNMIAEAIIHSNHRLKEKASWWFSVILRDSRKTADLKHATILWCNSRRYPGLYHSTFALSYIIRDCLIDYMRRDELRCHIYDSRNSLCLIDEMTCLVSRSIYDSRNSLCLIDGGLIRCGGLNLR